MERDRGVLVAFTGTGPVHWPGWPGQPEVARLDLQRLLLHPDAAVQQRHPVLRPLPTQAPGTAPDAHGGAQAERCRLGTFCTLILLVPPGVCPTGQLTPGHSCELGNSLLAYPPH